MTCVDVSRAMKYGCDYQHSHHSDLTREKRSVNDCGKPVVVLQLGRYVSLCIRTVGVPPSHVQPTLISHSQHEDHHYITDIPVLQVVLGDTVPVLVVVVDVVGVDYVVGAVVMRTFC